MFCKTMKRWLSGMLLFVLVVAFGSPASANLLYTAQTYYSNTKLGKVVGDIATLLTPNSIGGNWGQGIFPFKDARKRDRVAVALYQGGADTIKILDPADLSWTSPVQAVSPQDHSLSNIRKMVSMGNYLYGISYGNNPYGGQPSDIAHVRRFKTTNYASDNASFDYRPAAGQGHGEGLVAYDNHLYAILTTTTGGYPFGYTPNRLAKLNTDLVEVTSVGLEGKNTDGGTHGAYCQDGGTLYLTSWGGSQPTNTSYNPESRVEKVDLGDLTHSTLVTGQQMHDDDPTWNHHFTAVVVWGGEVYLQTTTWSRLQETGGSGGQVRLYKKGVADVGNLTSGDKVLSLDTGSGWRVGMVVDGDYLYVASGSNLYRYTLPVTADSAATVFGPGANNISLGGDISSFASVPSLRGVSAAQAAMDELVQAKAAKDEKDSSSGGCNAGLGWLLLLAVVPVALRRRG